MDLVINRSLVKEIEQVIDEDGSIKDSAVCSISRTSFLFLILHYDSYYLLVFFDLSWHGICCILALFNIPHYIVFSKTKIFKDASILCCCQSAIHLAYCQLLVLLQTTV